MGFRVGAGLLGVSVYFQRKIMCDHGCLLLLWLVGSSESVKWVIFLLGTIALLSLPPKGYKTPNKMDQLIQSNFADLKFRQEELNKGESGLFWYISHGPSLNDLPLYNGFNYTFSSLYSMLFFSISIHVFIFHMDFYFF